MELFYRHCQWRDENYSENKMKLLSEGNWVYYKGHSCTYSYQQDEQSFGSLSLPSCFIKANYGNKEHNLHYRWMVQFEQRYYTFEYLPDGNSLYYAIRQFGSEETDKTISSFHPQANGLKNIHDALCRQLVETLPSLKLLGVTGSLTYISVDNPFLEREA